MNILQITGAVLAVVVALGALAFIVTRSRKPAASGPAPANPARTVAAGTVAARTMAGSVPAPTMSATAIRSGQEEPLEEATARQQALLRLHELALTTELPETAPNETLHEEVASGVRWILTRVTEQENYAPRRPLLLPKLVAAMNDDDTSRRELVDIITSDPSLAGTLLKLANSPFYRMNNEPIESLDRAIAVLGLEGMRSLIAAALMQPVFRVDGGGFPKFGDVIWQHTLSAAKASQAYAASQERADPFAAQLLALVTGMAAIVVFRISIDQYQAKRLRPLPRLVLTLLETQTAPVARQVAASWQLTERIDVALADQSAPPGTPVSSLGRSLQFGRFLGALDVLNQRQVINEAGVMTALRSNTSQTGAYERIWSRRKDQARY